jgi:DNA-binding winged helix-turn-helix (wHTH) protein
MQLLLSQPQKRHLQVQQLLVLVLLYHRKPHLLLHYRLFSIIWRPIGRTWLC